MKSILVVIDSSAKGLEHNLKDCNVNDITLGVVTLADIEGLNATMLKNHEFEMVVLHSKELELEETDFGKAITKENGKFDIGLVSKALDKTAEHFLVTDKK